MLDGETFTDDPVAAPRPEFLPGESREEKGVGRADIYKLVTERVLEALDVGTVPWAAPWTGPTGQLPSNPVTGHTYRGVNILLTWLSMWRFGFTSAKWVTANWLFNQNTVRLKKAEGAEGTRTGQKTTLIVYYGNFEKAVTTPEGIVDYDMIPFLKGYRVFNLDQLENVPESWIDDIEIPSIEKRLDEVDIFARNTGAKIDTASNRAAYRPKEDQILMPSFGRFVHYAQKAGGTADEIERRADEGYHATQLHELIHWTGHESRQNRLAWMDLRAKEGHAIEGYRSAYAQEELIAEMGSAFLCARFGLPTLLQHASYIDYWRKLLRDDKKAIVKAAAASTRAIEFLDALQKGERNGENPRDE